MNHIESDSIFMSHIVSNINDIYPDWDNLSITIIENSDIIDMIFMYREDYEKFKLYILTVINNYKNSLFLYECQTNKEEFTNYDPDDSTPNSKPKIH